MRGDVCKETELVTKFGEWFSPNVWLDTTRSSETEIVPSLNGSPPVGVRLLIAATLSLNAHWRLIVRAPSARIVAIFTPSDFEGPDHIRWTGILDVPQISAELLGSQPGDKIEFRSGVALSASNAETRLFSIQADRPNWKPLYDSTIPPSQRRSGDAVGILVRNDESVVGDGATAHFVRTYSCCSGVMVSRNIFMTNWHCGLAPDGGNNGVWSDRVRTHTIIDLGWNSEGNQRLQYNVIGCWMLIKISITHCWKWRLWRGPAEASLARRWFPFRWINRTIMTFSILFTMRNVCRRASARPIAGSSAQITVAGRKARLHPRRSGQT